jgi:hypothetical protein
LHQWYWSYQYPDFLNSSGEFVEFDSYIVPESDLDEGALRMLEVASTINPSSSNSGGGGGGFWSTVLNAPDELTERCQNQLNNGVNGRDYASQSHDNDAVLHTKELREEVAIRYLARGGNLANTTVRTLQSGTFSGELRVCRYDTPMNMNRAFFNIIRN